MAGQDYCRPRLISAKVERSDLRTGRELGASGGAPTAVAYPVLSLCTGLAGNLWPDQAGPLLLVVGALVVVGIVRELAGSRLRAAPDDRVEWWGQRYSALVLLQATIWSTFTSGVVWIYGVDWTGLMALLTTAGVVAGSTSSLTPSFRLMRVYVIVLILPLAVALAHRPSRPQLTVAATLVTYCYFMIKVGRRNTDRYLSLSQTLVELEDSRRESEELAEELRRLSAAQQQAVERERLHLSREVHDDLGQLLTGLKISLARMEKTLENAAGLERLQECNDLVDATLGSVRRISSSLRPPLLDELGLFPAIDRFLNENLGRAQIGYQLKVAPGMQTLTSEQNLAAFRVCQEAVTNVVRHSQASTVTIEFSVVNAFLCLRIQDNGVGVNPQKVGSSLGLLGLRERLHLLGGEARLSSLPGSGTLLDAKFPLLPP